MKILKISKKCESKKRKFSTERFSNSFYTFIEELYIGALYIFLTLYIFIFIPLSELNRLTDPMPKQKEFE